MYFVLYGGVQTLFLSLSNVIGLGKYPGLYKCGPSHRLVFTRWDWLVPLGDKKKLEVSFYDKVATLTWHETSFLDYSAKFWKEPSYMASSEGYFRHQ